MLATITAINSLSSLGNDKSDIWQRYLSEDTLLTRIKIANEEDWVGVINQQDKQEILKIREENIDYRHLDDTVIAAIFVARKALVDAQWNDHQIGINIGSSRGATGLFEKYHNDYLKKQPLSPYTSPHTTLGNISSWVAHDLGCEGIDISHSIACSTGLHSVLNGVAWLSSGLSDYFIAGASEMPLTGFTLSQMKSLKVYVNPEPNQYPCKAFDLTKKSNTMVLGEGAAMVCMQRELTDNAIAVISAIGYATEVLTNGVSISTNADCMQKAMRMAIKNKKIDAIVTHTPGTLKGDNAEYNAIKQVFGLQLPLLTNNKWRVGHTFATSGLLSLEMAVLMLQHQTFIGIPYLDISTKQTSLNNILVNAVGFGGNAVSILVSRIP